MSMTSCNLMCCHLCNGSHEPFLNKTRLGGVTRLSPHCFYPSVTYPIPRFVSNQAYLGSFGMVSWASYKFERTIKMVTANMERNVSRHHTELVCLSD
ncbi:uncharacterized protein TNCV_1184041 [Trichonephila clavipes]|nr:uncharacterized protein TNCV_1184041 [Trichonephila clavipes]